jgi:hypothetical protein
MYKIGFKQGKKEGKAQARKDFVDGLLRTKIMIEGKRDRNAWWRKVMEYVEEAK